MKIALVLEILAKISGVKMIPSGVITYADQNTSYVNAHWVEQAVEVHGPMSHSSIGHTLGSWV